GQVIDSFTCLPTGRDLSAWNRMPPLDRSIVVPTPESRTFRRHSTLQRRLSEISYRRLKRLSRRATGASLFVFGDIVIVFSVSIDCPDRLWRLEVMRVLTCWSQYAMRSTPQFRSPLQVKLPQALPTAVLARNGPGDRVVEQPAVQVTECREHLLPHGPPH